MATREEIREGMEKIVKICANKPNVYTPEMCAIDLAEYLHDNDVVIKVDRELPPEREWLIYPLLVRKTIQAGCSFFEPLIEEE